MFSNIHRWATKDTSELGRPQLNGNQPVNQMAIPMCVLSLVHELDDLQVESEAADLEGIRIWCVHEIKQHVQRDGKRVLETVDLEGNEIAGHEGRKLLPGHAIECGWFLLIEAEKRKSKELEKFAIEHFIENPMEYGIDKEYGGLFYYLDVDGK